jgi:preprotein translocase subunit SecD
MMLAATCVANAAPLVVKVQGASMIADAQTHRPALELVVRPASRPAFDQFMAQHAGQKIAVLVHGKTTLTSVARTPAASGTMEITGAPVSAMRELIGQLSMRHAKIAIDVAPN